jgi:hypothetical protein
MFTSIPQCTFIEGIPEIGGTVYRLQVTRRLRRPYTFRHNCAPEKITGIACLPINESTPSPEAEVVEGGINSTFVVLCLTPVDDGDWGCVVTICGASESTSSKASRFPPRSDGNYPFKRLQLLMSSSRSDGKDPFRRLQLLAP